MRLKTVYYSITSGKIPKEFDGCKIAHLSDLHSKSFGPNNKVLSDLLFRQRPDYIFLTGDMINGYDKNFRVFLNLAERIGKSFPSFYIAGNHEQALNAERLYYLKKALVKRKLKILYNNSITLRRANSRIDLYGMELPMRYYRDHFHDFDKHAHFVASDLRDLIGDVNPSNFSILLAHNPLFFDAYKKWGADLTYSGHIHGGIIRIPLLGGLLSPETRFFPKYDGGLFTEHNKQLIVSRGLGNNFFIRINNPPEVSFTVLHKK